MGNVFTYFSTSFGTFIGEDAFGLEGRAGMQDNWGLLSGEEISLEKQDCLHWRFTVWHSPVQASKPSKTEPQQDSKTQGHNFLSFWENF